MDFNSSSAVPAKAEHVRCSCGVFVLAGEGHDCHPKRQSEALERIATALERLAAFTVYGATV